MQRNSVSIKDLLSWLLYFKYPPYNIVIDYNLPYLLHSIVLYVVFCVPLIACCLSTLKHIKKEKTLPCVPQIRIVLIIYLVKFTINVSWIRKMYYVYRAEKEWEIPWYNILVGTFKYFWHFSEFLHTFHIKGFSLNESQNLYLLKGESDKYCDNLFWFVLYNGMVYGL